MNFAHSISSCRLYALGKAKLILVRETLGDNQKRYDTRSDARGFKLILFTCMQIVCFCGEVGYLQIMLIQL